jgi:hypothetical protein
LSPTPVHEDPDVALLPAARNAFDDLVARGLDHRWALHHRSSQALALNLFAPLGERGSSAAAVLLDLGASAVEAVEFEYSDPDDRLGEISHRSVHRTQVDVVLRGTSAAGERVVALIEVKFTESDFGHCSAYENVANPRRDVCRSSGLFGDQPADCFQLANHGDGRRTYDTQLLGVPTVRPAGGADDGGCLVRRSLNQPMRNLALAHLLLNAGEAERVVCALCAPAGHPTIWRRFGELRDAFPDTARRTIRGLTAEQVASLHADGGAAIAALYPAGPLQWTPPQS